MSSYEEEPHDPYRYSTGSNQEQFGRSQRTGDISLNKLEAKLNSQRGSPSLNLSDGFIGDDGCDLLARFITENPTLELIDLRGNNISSAGLTTLSHAFRNAHSLKSIGLEWNNLRSGTAPLVDAFGYHGQLRMLDIRNNRVSADGAQHISRLIELNRSIETIDLRWNEIGTVGAQMLIKSLQRPHYVKRIELSGNNIPEDYIQQIDNLLRDEYGGQSPTRENYSPRQHTERFSPRKDEERQMSPRQESYSPRLHTQETSLSPRRPSEAMVPASLLNKEKEYTDELQSKYEGQIINANRTERKLNELELHFEQESRRNNEIKQDLLREIDTERLLKSQAEEALMLYKEDALKKELEGSRAIQDLEYKINRVQGEKAQVQGELENMSDQFDKTQYANNEKLTNMEDRLLQQQRLYKQLDETSKQSQDRSRRDHEDEIRDLRRDYGLKIESVEEANRQQRATNDTLENEIKQLRGQMAQQQTAHKDQLVDLENAVRDEETKKFNNILYSLEQRMKGVEDARENLAKRNQDLQMEMNNNDKRASDTILTLESQVNSLRDDRNELSRQLSGSNGQVESLRMELHGTHSNLERSQQECDDLLNTLKQHKESHINQLEKLNLEHNSERRQLEGARDMLNARANELESKLQRMTNDRDRILREHERLSEDLRNKASDLI